MDEESANWCRLVQTIIHKGGEVLRQFLQLEILTKIFTKYSRFWMNNVHNPCDINYMEILANNLNRILIGSDNPSEKIIEELLDSWSTTHGQRMTVIEQIDRLKEWKHDVDNKCLNSVSSSDKIILNNCLSQIEQEIEKLDSIWTFLNKWDYTFHCNLQIAQTDLLSEIEKNDEFLSRCRYVLTSLSKPSSTEFQQHVRSFKKELNIWKIKCSKVLRGFKEECDTLIASGLREIKCSPQLNILNRFLTDFKMNINNENLQSQIDIFCDTWDDDLHHLFDRYEKKIQDSDSTAILSLSQSLCKDLEKFPTFKEKKFQDFLLTATKLPGLSTIERSKLKDISRCSNLNEFDFNLLIAVLMHGNFVHSPPPNRDEDPHKLDISISADILRLRAYRNNIVDHTVQVKISSDTFDKLWKELLMLLRKIASQCGDNFNKKISMEIDQMKDHPLEPHRETKLQQEFLTWCRKDILNQLTPEAYMYLDILQSLQMAEENLSRRRQARTCCSCKKEFPTESELEKHTRIHKDCRCRSCNKEFLTESELQLHMKYHEARTCLRCNMECSTEKGLARHMMCHQAHICLSCNQAFSTGIELEQHLRYHQACTCRSCSMEFPTENELAEHVRNHKGDHNAPEIQVRNERKQFAIDETSKLIEQDTSQKRPARDDNYDLQTQKKQKVDKEQSSVETEIHPSVQNMEDSEEDAEGDLLDEYDFFEAIRNDDKKVEDMIRNQKIPKQRIVEVAMKRDRCSSGIKRALIEMSKLLRKKISKAVGVWCGYRPEFPHTPVFVVTLEDNKCILKKEDIPEPFINYKMITRYKHVPNDEERNIVKQYGRNSVRSEDVALVNNTIAKHTEKYMKEHSNLSIIRPCSIKSFGYTRNKMEVENVTCIVFYVPVKGVIPVGEKEFPKYINGIITDVREGEFLLFGRHTAMEFHTKLKIGCCITSGIKNGSLGGFVDLPGGKVGCLTAGHVVLTDYEIQDYHLKSNEVKKKYNDYLAQGKMRIEMHQPKMGHGPFGKVQTIALDEGNIFTPSVDAAVIQITDDDRQPETGSFPDGNFEKFDVTKDDPLFYTSGEILDDVQTDQKDYRVIKFGCTTGLTLGSLQCTESSVRPVDVWGNYCFPVMFRQLEVSEPDFADVGDSGALVFLCVGTNIRNLQAVGMVIGGHSTGCSCLITPIKAVFEKLGLKNDKFKVFPASRLSQVIERISLQGREVSKHDEIVGLLSAEVSLIKEKVTRMDAIEAKVNSLEKNMKEGFESMQSEMIKGFRNLNELFVKNQKSDSS